MLASTAIATAILPLNTEKDIPPDCGGPISEPNIVDVLSGRGGRIAQHPGNVYFRQLVRQYKPTYLSKQTKKLDKAKISATIVKTIRDMGGKFLKEAEHDTEEGTSIVWIEIGDVCARKKTGQAMREKPSEGRRNRRRSEQQMNTTVLQPIASTPSFDVQVSSPAVHIQKQSQAIVTPGSVPQSICTMPMQHLLTMRQSKPNALPDSLIQECISEILPIQPKSSSMQEGMTASTISLQKEVDGQEEVDPNLLSEMDSSFHDDSLNSSVAPLNEELDEVYMYGDEWYNQLPTDDFQLVDKSSKKRSRLPLSESTSPKKKAKHQADARRKQFHMMKNETSNLPSFQIPQTTSSSNWLLSYVQR